MKGCDAVWHAGIAHTEMDGRNPDMDPSGSDRS